MKRILSLFLFLIALVPAVAFAGQGSDAWYSAWFNDRDDNGSLPFCFRTWIQVTNPNSSPATLQITYYQVDGTKFTDENGNSTFMHTVPANGRASWRPNLDLNLSATVVLQGSFTIIVTEGSITADESISSIATLALGDPNYTAGSVASVWSKPLQTVTSTFLTMDSLMQYDSNNDNRATIDGETITWLNLCNPSDTMPAEATITFYDDFGNILAGPETLTFGTHQTHTFTAGDKGVNGTNGQAIKGGIVIDVTKGSLIGCFAKHYCNISNSSNGAKNYRSYGSVLNKRLNIK